MAAIYLKHKYHGTKVAIAEEEAVADEKRGWERYVPTAHKMDPVQMAKDEADSMIAWERKRA